MHAVLDPGNTIQTLRAFQTVHVILSSSRAELYQSFHGVGGFIGLHCEFIHRIRLALHVTRQMTGTKREHCFLSMPYGINTLQPRVSDHPKMSRQEVTGHRGSKFWVNCISWFAWAWKTP